MTKAIVAALLAASSILPGIASAQDARADRPQLSEAQREARAERRAERQANRGQDGGGQQQGAGRQERSPEQRAERRERRMERQDAGSQRGGRGGDWRNGTGQGGNEGRPVDRDRSGGRFDAGRYDRDRTSDAGWGRGGGVDRDGDRSGWDRRSGGYDARYATRAPQRWSNDWRHDGRYDWNRYRSYNRDAFRMPRYHAPGGWGYGYRRFSIGVRIAAPLFGRNYWIADPWAYRLPPAYGPYRWVRYYNDAVMVDLRTGSVVDVIHGIFW